MQFMRIEAALDEQYDILYRDQLMLELRTSYACDDESQIYFHRIERKERRSYGATEQLATDCQY